MEYEQLKQSIVELANKDLQVRKNWYSNAAIAYDRARPKYPQQLIDRVIEIADINPNSTILEVGCGPGTATLSFAPLGCSTICLEPNLDFYKLVRHNCRAYANVEIKNTSLEEWELEEGKFDVVLGASSFHWLPIDIAYRKAAQALKKDGHLILLWNKELQPTYEVYQQLLPAYQLHAPSLARYEDKATQEKILAGLERIAIDSLEFINFQSEFFETFVKYTVDEYLMLLNTYSPYLKLAPEIKTSLFKDLQIIIESELEGELKLSYLSAFHIGAKKIFN
jgi:SAM-dependent methyltransferase